MIQSIQLTNFQSHKNTTIEFVEGLNVIAGSSDSGKSAVLRGFRWVSDNRPSGDSIKNWDCKKGDTVEVHISADDTDVFKERTDGKSKYIVHGKGYEAFKQDVPEEIKQALNLSEHNVQTQHDPYFLLNDSPGEVAKKLNELIGLDVIDRLFKFINGKITDTKRSLENETNRSNTLSDEIQKLDYLDRLEVEIDVLDTEIKKRDALVDVSTIINYLVSQIETAEKEITHAKEILKAEPLMLDILNKIKEHDSLEDNFNDVEDIWQNIASLDVKIQDDKDWLVVEDYYKDVKERIEDYQALQPTVTSVSAIVKSINSIQDQENRLQLNYERLKGEYEDVLKRNKMCPLCLTPVDKKMIERILK